MSHKVRLESNPTSSLFSSPKLPITRRDESVCWVLQPRKAKPFAEGDPVGEGLVDGHGVGGVCGGDVGRVVHLCQACGPAGVVERDALGVAQRHDTVNEEVCLVAGADVAHRMADL